MDVDSRSSMESINFELFSNKDLLILAFTRNLGLLI
jgi:hypothetical protein